MPADGILYPSFTTSSKYFLIRSLFPARLENRFSETSLNRASTLRLMEG